MTKKKSRRKMYNTEFLIRSDNETLIADLDKIARPKGWSVNQLIVNTMEKVVEKSKKSLVISG
jgi:hypothetical protein